MAIRLIFKSRDRFAKLLSAGIIIAITAQAAINIGVVTVVLPTKGIALPFISAGGTGLLLSAAAVGILINIANNPENIPQTEE
jgi:cell division protein FtsW